jgi:hypothetical protein
VGQEDEEEPSGDTDLRRERRALCLISPGGLGHLLGWGSSADAVPGLRGSPSGCLLTQSTCTCTPTDPLIMLVVRNAPKYVRAPVHHPPVCALIYSTLDRQRHASRITPRPRPFRLAAGSTQYVDWRHPLANTMPLSSVEVCPCPYHLLNKTVCLPAFSAGPGGYVAAIKAAQLGLKVRSALAPSHYLSYVPFSPRPHV